MTEFVSTQTVIFVDDDEPLRTANAQSLMLADIAVSSFSDAPSALAHIDENFTGAVVTDIRMPGMDGLAFFERIHAIDPDIPVIIITGHADVPMALGALKSGAFDFLTKPFASDHFIASVRKALETRRLILDNRRLRAMAATPPDSPLIGSSPAMQRVRAAISQLARADIDVIVEGETGTGKELAAHMLHRNGPRAGRPFVAINCGALTEQSAEVELFGYDRAAGGHGPISREGHIVRADRGTLFLDEIDSMALPLQAKLLRLLEEREVLAVGASEPRTVDLRVIASAKSDLQQAVERGAFRDDLYYRLNVARLQMPPLRNRGNDAVELFAAFVDEASKQLAVTDFHLSDSTLRYLSDHDWPGNVRELRNFAYSQVLGLSERADEADADLLPLHQRVAQFEAQIIRDSLLRTKGDIAATVSLLQIPRKTLYDKLTRYQIIPGDYRKSK